VLHCIIHPLVAQLLQANKVFHTEQLHEGTGPNDTDDPRLSNTAFIDQVVAFSVLAVVELSAADRRGAEGSAPRDLFAVSRHQCADA
jgi:alpha-ketoglutarate-dependent taurine dioxygenase